MYTALDTKYISDHKFMRCFKQGRFYLYEVFMFYTKVDNKQGLLGVTNPHIHTVGKQKSQVYIGENFPSSQNLYGKLLRQVVMHLNLWIGPGLTRNPCKYYKCAQTL